MGPRLVCRMAPNARFCSEWLFGTGIFSDRKPADSAGRSGVLRLRKAAGFQAEERYGAVHFRCPYAPPGKQPCPCAVASSPETQRPCCGGASALECELQPAWRVVPRACEAGDFRVTPESSLSRLPHA